MLRNVGLHGLYYSVDSRIQTYTEPVPLNMENSPQNMIGYRGILTVHALLFYTVLFRTNKTYFIFEKIHARILTYFNILDSNVRIQNSYIGFTPRLPRKPNKRV